MLAGTHFSIILMNFSMWFHGRNGSARSCLMRRRALSRCVKVAARPNCCTRLHTAFVQWSAQPFQGYLRENFANGVRCTWNNSNKFEYIWMRVIRRKTTLRKIVEICLMFLYVVLLYRGFCKYDAFFKIGSHYFQWWIPQSVLHGTKNLKQQNYFWLNRQL